MRDTPNTSSASLKLAFAEIAHRRKTEPRAELASLIEAAASRFGLSSTQRTWLRWSIDPDSMALQSKQPSCENEENVNEQA